MGFIDEIREWFDAQQVAPSQRTSGKPTSSNGASSHHLFWKVTVDSPVVEVRATLEVLVRPSVQSLYFWALQASFADGGRVHGGAHLGLQHHPEYPKAGAANWGGYHDRSQGGGIMDGTPLIAPSALGNANTCNFDWQPNTPYRLRISKGPQGWLGSITPRGESEVVLRELFCDGAELRSPLMWTESFAECDAPPATVRWSDCAVVTARGDTHPVHAVSINYQSIADGGCSTSDSRAQDAGFQQSTGVVRSTQGGATLSI